MLNEIIERAIRPAYALLPAGVRSREATVLLLAIGLQESAFLHRRQIKGPARGFWQFEPAAAFAVFCSTGQLSGTRLRCLRVRIGWKIKGDKFDEVGEFGALVFTVNPFDSYGD